MQSAPAWMYSVWMLWTIFGSDSFSTSKQVSRGTPARRAWSPWRRRRGGDARGGPRRTVRACVTPKGPGRPLERLAVTGAQDPGDAGGDLVGSERRGIDGEGRPSVEGLAGAIEGAHVVARPAREHRALATAERALVQRLEIAGQPDDRAEGPERLRAPSRQGRPPPVAITSPRFRARSRSTSSSAARKYASPSAVKISGMERPSAAVIMSSVSTRHRPSRRARRRPTDDLPAPMNPTKTILPSMSDSLSIYRA